MKSPSFSHREDRKWRAPAFLCTYCGKTFTTRQARRNHLGDHQEEVQLRRRQCCSANNNGNLLVPSTNIQPERLNGVARPNIPDLNLEYSPSKFSQDNSLVNVSNNTANNPANGIPRLIAPPNLSSNGGCTGIRCSNYSSMGPPTMVSAGTTSLSPPIFAPFGNGRISLGPANPLHNCRCAYPRMKRPYMGDVGGYAQLRSRQVTGYHQLVQSEEQPKKELFLFKDVSCIVVSPDAAEENQDLDLSLHL